MSLRFVSLFLVIASACTTYGAKSPKDEASEQIASGDALAPTNDQPVVIGNNGLLMLYCAYRAGGCGNLDQFGQLGVSPDLVMNWDPAKATFVFDYIDGPDGNPIYTATFPYPSSFRGIPAEFDAKEVDWSTEDGSELAKLGQSDGYYGLKTSFDNVATVYNCNGKPSLNIIAGWDEDGNPDYMKANQAITYGEDYCDSQ